MDLNIPLTLVLTPKEEITIIKILTLKKVTLLKKQNKDQVLSIQFRNSTLIFPIASMNHRLIRWRIRMLELGNKVHHKFNVIVEEEVVRLTHSFLQIRKRHRGTIIIEF